MKKKSVFGIVVRLIIINKKIILLQKLFAPKKKKTETKIIINYKNTKNCKKIRWL